jgi:hypothetical protein
MSNDKPRAWRIEDLKDVEHDPRLHDIVVDRISAILTGRDPRMQGAVLADLVSKYFAGHHPEIRENGIDVWIKAMRGLIEVHEQEMLARFGGRWPE